VNNGEHLRSDEIRGLAERTSITCVYTLSVVSTFACPISAIYEAESGHRVDAWWDIHALRAYGPSWKQFLPIQIDGRAPLDVEGMTGRMEKVLDRALRRL
jgi:hypothetical protein